MTIDIAVVPVAGHGTRLLPATKSQPKEMLPVGRKPTVQWIIEELSAAGVEHVLFVTGPGKAAIEMGPATNNVPDPTIATTGNSGSYVLPGGMNFPLVLAAPSPPWRL